MAAFATQRQLGRFTSILLLIATIAVLWAWMRTGFDLPFDDRALDDLAASGSLSTADALITSVEATDRTAHGETLVRVHYEWTLDGTPMQSAAFAEPGQFQAGLACAMEYVPGDPTIQRPRGATQSVSSRLTPWLLVLWAVPFVLWLLRLRYSYRQKAQVDGDKPGST